ncbi:hypothetical protein D9M70_532210 [compost metagenome]
MRGLRQKALMSCITVIKPHQRIVDRRHHRQEFRGYARDRHLDAALVIFDMRRMRGRVGEA